MNKWLQTSPQSLLNIILCAIGIYIAVIVCTRIAGKRSFSKMSSFDFAITVAIGSIVASTILSSSVSVVDGAVGLIAVYVLQMTAASLRSFSFFEKMIDNSPLLLMDGQEILEENLKKAKVTKADLHSKLREANVIKFSQVKAVVFEATGDISVLHAENSDMELEAELLTGVKR
ncbi:MULTISPECIES: DUF421 domain-containing protein [Mesonia]|uniref:Uncharacterized protein n=1 Tax=Mesonia oceanica TaxID=2687242 RepID=A0AC61Y9L4_9FLAO|nr:MULTISPECIES: YetF domain-containing protein [Mesonia]MAN27811.1 hypothetical protein [Mesonia sp.]MAQ40991.1 hypothetical protein [Mesonia sp.]MBJ96469.1 hypothetical protein [Flavobacteriaceae bacterium]VVV01083.1 hypothetical protein FVB9532_02362 [Mesonia oceanica]|tara:strand:- start:85983 stop:86504 length:522 start_codon:yes stop_codon:yes gene_type:complete